MTAARSGTGSVTETWAWRCPTPPCAAEVGGAGSSLNIPSSPVITLLRVPASGQAIARHVRASDLVVEAGLPLAAQVVTQGAQALNPRGTLYTPANLPEYLTMRRVTDERRQSGMDTSGPAPFRARGRQACADQLDRWVTRARQTGDGTPDEP